MAGTYVDTNGNPTTAANAVTDSPAANAADTYLKQQEAEDKDALAASVESQLQGDWTKQSASTPTTATPTKSTSPSFLNSFLGAGQTKDAKGNLVGETNANLLSSLIGANAALPATNAGLASGEKTMQGAYDNYQNIYDQANPTNLQVQLQQAQMANYNPAILEAAPTITPSAYANVGPNQNILNQQMANNASLQQVAHSGFTPEMMAAYNNMQNAGNANFQANLAGIQQSQAARGMGSSGASLAMRQNAAQAAQNNAAMATGNIAAQGFQNKLAAMNQLGGLTNAQQAQLTNTALAKAQGLQQNAQYGTTLGADIAARNAASQNRQQNLQTTTQNQFSKDNTTIANQEAYQNMVNSRIQAAQMAQNAAGGMANVGSSIATLQGRQGANQGAAQGITATNVAGLGMNLLQNPDMINNAITNVTNLPETFSGLGSDISSGLESLGQFFNLG